MLQPDNYSLVLLIQLVLLAYDLLVNSFSELLRTMPIAQLVLFIIQDIGVLFNLMIILLMLFNTYVFQVGLVSLLLERFRALLLVCLLYLALNIASHCWLTNLRWQDYNHFVWTDGLQVLFVFQRLAADWVFIAPRALDSERRVLGWIRIQLNTFPSLALFPPWQCCITTYTSGRQNALLTHGSMRTPSGCVRHSPMPVSKGREQRGRMLLWGQKADLRWSATLDGTVDTRENRREQCQVEGHCGQRQRETAVDRSA
ncbi:hypothetical protein SKAU_G00064530 [Synaphobranchus kaupii]|uniref:Transmembrane protein 138 n=1 Tax=Synaphobranchus kaupii TaxID=118154 RepID=A0A9Q1JAQ3_SYNKA|nr:hypothetical protein SKAU_G00064530 [Synaphobranchus kaupii]